MTYQVGRTLAQVAVEYGGSQHGNPGTRVADPAGQQLAGGRALQLAVRDPSWLGLRPAAPGLGWAPGRERGGAGGGGGDRP